MQGQGASDFYVAFTMNFLRWIKTDVHKFAISSHTALKLGIETGYFKLHISPNTKVGTAKDHGKNCTKVRPPFVRRLLRNRLLKQATLPGSKLNSNMPKL